MRPLEGEDDPSYDVDDAPFDDNNDMSLDELADVGSRGNPLPEDSRDEQELPPSVLSDTEEDMRRLIEGEEHEEEILGDREELPVEDDLVFGDGKEGEQDDLYFIEGGGEEEMELQHEEAIASSPSPSVVVTGVTSEVVPLLSSPPPPWAPASIRDPRLPSSYPAKGKGSRKSSHAHVFLSSTTSGAGRFTLNLRHLADYMLHHRDWIAEAASPLMATQLLNTTDVRAFAKGGGLHGKAGAIKLALSRALVNLHPELKPQLKKQGFLKVDRREVEPKKSGRLKARKMPQWSKR